MLRVEWRPAEKSETILLLAVGTQEAEMPASQRFPSGFGRPNTVVYAMAIVGISKDPMLLSNKKDAKKLEI